MERELLKNYLSVTKPGIILGNMISMMGGFFLASRGQINTALLLSTALGISLVIASACVLNNCVDRDLDRMMTRTRERVLAKGMMLPRAAVLYACVLCMGGIALLQATSNLLCVAVVQTGFVIYVVVYSLYLKRHSAHAALIGSLAGAAPPLAGYCAASNRFDLGAVILLLMFCLWQIPHFYSIAIVHLDEYAAAGIPVFPAVHGVAATKRQIVGYILGFTLAAAMLTFGGYTGYRYLAVVVGLGMAWLVLAWQGYKTSDDRAWARRLFFCSILIVPILCFMMGIDFAVPSR
jgi:heme o synthase